MWLSEKLGVSDPPFRLTRGKVTISADDPAVDADGERRDTVIIAPAGIHAVPATGAAAVVAPCDGETVLIGCPRGESASSVTLEAGGALLTLDSGGLLLSFGSGSLRMSSDSAVLSLGDSSLELRPSGAALRCGSHRYYVSLSGVSGA